MTVPRFKVEVGGAPRSRPLGMPYCLHLWWLGALSTLECLSHDSAAGSGEEAAGVGVWLGKAGTGGRERCCLAQVLQVGLCGGAG